MEELTMEETVCLYRSTAIADAIANYLKPMKVAYDFDLQVVNCEEFTGLAVVVWLALSETMTLKRAQKLGIDLVRVYSKLPEDVKEIGLDIRLRQPTECKKGDVLETKE